MPEGQTQRQAARTLGAAVLILAGFAAYAAVAYHTLRNGRTTFEEVGYLIRSWWYTAGTAAPYTATDATWQMPFYFYVLGWWQKIAGVGHHPARLLSIGLGLISAGFLFATCRRLTGNVLASAAGVLVFLATPATAYAFSMATPVALVSTLHIAAIWLLVSSLGRPRAWATIVFALLCVAIFFTRQNLAPGLIVLAALYIAALGKDRGPHTALLLGVIAVTSALVLFGFPGRLAANALRLPLIAPTLSHWGILLPDFGLIQQGTTGAAVLLPGFAMPNWTEVLDTFVLPYAGLIVLSLVVFFVAGEKLRVLWIAPLYFFGLAAVHIAATGEFCAGCMIADTPTFAAAGALASALGLAIFASIARRNDVSPALVIFAGGIFGAALNAFAPTLAREEAYRYFPAPQLVQPRPDLELTEIDTLSRWLRTTVPGHDPILILHNEPGLPYAVFLASETFPVQSIDPQQTKRTIKPRLVGETREAIQAAVEAQSLWTDDTQRRWIERDFELVLLAQANSTDQSALAAELNQRFDVVATHPFRGQMLTLYHRKALQ